MDLLRGISGARKENSLQALIQRAAVVSCSALLLAACSSGGPPSCTDLNTQDLLDSILVEQMGGVDKDVYKQFSRILEARETATEPFGRKCTATLAVNAGRGMSADDQNRLMAAIPVTGDGTSVVQSALKDGWLSVPLEYEVRLASSDKFSVALVKGDQRLLAAASGYLRADQRLP